MLLRAALAMVMRGAVRSGSGLLLVGVGYWLQRQRPALAATA